MMLERFLGSAEAARALDDTAFVQAMLDFEAALARAQGRAGAIPRAAADAIARACHATRFDPAAIAEDGALAGSLAIPLTKALVAEVARTDAEASMFVHWGATSQDVLDTAQVLVGRRVLALVDRDLGALGAALLGHAQAQQATPVLARTLLQPAQVTSVDFKLAGWVAPLVRARTRLREAGARALQLQLGGAVGTRAALGEHADAVAAAMAQALQLRAPAAAWHTQRDELVALACELGVLAGSLGKIAKDIALMSQGEIGELAEGRAEGRGGSSTMPNKRNPVGAMVALAAAVRVPQRVAALLAAMPQAHERGLGDWQAELAEFSGLLASVHGAVFALRHAAEGLQFDAARMRAGIEAQRGLVFAEGVSMRLARAIGKPAAHRQVEQWSKRALADGEPLCDVALEGLAGDERLRAAVPVTELRALFDVDATARHASALAQAQLAALAVEAARQQRDPPWQAWLPAGDGEKGNA
jgi:3-carboxy-cis,cis-muconate cycloisomerase